jgi:hypothetical protein
MRVRPEAPERLPALLAAAEIAAPVRAPSVFRPPLDGVDAPDACYLTHRFFCRAGLARATVWLERSKHLGEESWRVRITSPAWTWLLSVCLRVRLWRLLRRGESAAAGS